MNDDSDLVAAIESNIRLCDMAIKKLDDLNSLDWTMPNLQKICDVMVVEFDEQLSRSLIIEKEIHDFQSFDFNSLIQKILSIKKISANMDDEARENVFNKPYVVYSSDLLTDVNMKLKQFLDKYADHFEKEDAQNRLNSVSSSLISLDESIDINQNELYEHFRYGNKNYVIFGKNGSGKTTLLRKISSSVLKENSVVIPADRNVKVDESRFRSLDSKSTFNEKLASSNAMTFLFNDMQEKEIEQYRDGDPTDKDIFKKARGIFNSLGMERTIDIQGLNAYLSADSKDSEKYPLSQGSDGERTVVYMILAVLLSPKNAYIFIDEPENHLNGLLMRDLFDSLELARPDSRFVYLTHKIDFVESRTNAELLYLGKTNQPQNWEFKELSDFKDIDLNVILNIEGSQKDLVFCEGNNTSSIDNRILTVAYPEYTVMPVGSCVTVRNSTVAINKSQSIFLRRAFGVIDGDFQIPDEILSSKEQGILTLEYNEWESLLLDDDVVNVVNDSIDLKSIETVKQAVIDCVSQNINDILNDFLNKRFLKIVSTCKLKIDNNLESTLDRLNEENKATIKKQVAELKEEIDDNLNLSGYETIVKLVPGKMLLGTATKAMGLADKDLYIQRALELARKDADFRKTLREKINLESMLE